MATGGPPSTGTEKDVLLPRYLDFEWAENVEAFRCGRCRRVLIRHYVSDCGHKFCLNCKKILGDGSERWRCPLPGCGKFIKEVSGQNSAFQKRVYELKVRCPNRKYGCDFVSALKNMEEHLKKCKHSKEKALPALYRGSADTKMVLEHIIKINQSVGELKEKVKGLEEKMAEMEDGKRAKDLAQDLKWEDMIDGVRSDVHVLTIRFNNDILDLKANGNAREVDKKFDDLNARVNEVLHLVNENPRWSEVQEQINKLNSDVEAKLKKISGKMHGNLDVWFDMLDKKEEKIMENTKQRMDQLNREYQHILDNYKTEFENKVLEKFQQFEEEKQSIIKRVENNMDVYSLKIEELSNQIKQYKSMVSQQNEQIKEIENVIENEIKNIKDIKDKINFKQTSKYDIKKAKKINLTESGSLAFNRQNELQPFHVVDYSSSRHPDFTWRIRLSAKGFRDKYTSEAFTFYQYPFCAEAQLDHGELFLAFKDTRDTRQALRPRLLPTFYFVIKHPTGSQDTCLTLKHYFKTHIKYDAPSHCAWGDALWNEKAPEGQEIVFKVYVEPLLIARQLYSTNGCLWWWLDNFRKMKSMAHDGLLWPYESPYFYTGEGGYRVQVTMFLYGGQGFDRLSSRALVLGEWAHQLEHIELFARVVFVPGEFDADLSEPFSHMTKITLVNRKEPSRNITKRLTRNIKEKSYYVMNIDNLETIEKLVEDDTLYYEISVKSIKQY